MTLKIVPVADADSKPSLRMVRVEIELDDGTVEIWSGEDAIHWAKVVNEVLALHQLRTGTLLNIPKPTKVLKLPSGVKVE
jgi:hypothetical protein